MGTGSKLALGMMTAGLSLAATGVSGKGGSEMIPIANISSVTTKRDGLAFTNVVVVCSGNTIKFRVAHASAEPIKVVLTQLMLGSHPSQAVAQRPLAPVQTAPPQPVAPAEAAPVAAQATSPAERIAVAKDLLDQGLISQDDFDAKRQAILDEI